MFSKSNSIKKFGKNSILLSPNLGKPQIISFPKHSKDDKETFLIELLFITEYDTTQEQLLINIEGNIKIRPLVDFDEVSKRGIRGDELLGRIMDVKKAPIIPLGDQELIFNYNYESPRGIPIKLGIYDEKNKYFIVKMEFDFSGTVKSVIDRDGFVVFDIIQHFPDIDLGSEIPFKTNYHACVISDQTWEDCTIIHGTDLHIAKRNDEILAVILKKLNQKPSDGLEKRFVNPNNNLRLFIKSMNEWKKDRHVDLIIFTGDIVDFCIRSDGGDSIETFDLPNTNWNIFYNIILNYPLTYREDIEPVNIFTGEELMIPLYTVVGNHDYHPYHYDIRLAGLHKGFNIKPKEAMSYKDKVQANPLTSLYSNRKTLMGYNQNINPYQNFHIKLGDHLLMFLDSGTDSLKAMRDLISGSPSVYGFTEDIMGYIKNVVTNKTSQRGIRIAFCHSPIINPQPLSMMKKKLRSDFEKKGLKSLDDFKEENLNQINEGESRSDPYKYGCVTNNWVETIELYNDFKINAISGHSHDFFEFRTKKTDSTTEFKSKIYLIKNKQIEVPVAIFMEDYSKKNVDSNFIMQNLPFHLQTPALGVGRYDKDKNIGPFRIIKIKNNKLASFKVEYISKLF
jgi:predicted MPP superfamily phosphohydrolase